MVKPSPVQIFLAHSSGDKPAVLELYKRLQSKGYSPWLDKKSIIGGQNWREEIPKAIKKGDVVIACLSKQSVSKEGYVQEELRLALVEYSQKLPGSIYLIPLKLESCEVPDTQVAQLGVSLRDLQWIDYWEPDGFERLVHSIRQQQHQVKKAQSNLGPASVPMLTSSDHETKTVLPLVVLALVTMGLLWIAYSQQNQQKSPVGIVGKRPEISKIAWSDTIETLNLRGRLSEEFTYLCPADGYLTTEIWGTDVYSDKSSICTAAVHVGIIDIEHGGEVTIRIKNSIKNYKGSIRNGAVSKDYPKETPGSFIFIE